jgi:hypothetical protein
MCWLRSSWCYACWTGMVLFFVFWLVWYLWIYTSRQNVRGNHALLSCFFEHPGHIFKFPRRQFWDYTFLFASTQLGERSLFWDVFVGIDCIQVSRTITMCCFGLSLICASDTKKEHKDILNTCTFWLHLLSSKYSYYNNIWVYWWGLTT